MVRTSVRLRKLATSSLIALSLAAAASAQAAGEAIEFDIEAQPLADALADFSRQSNLMIVASSALTDGLTAPAVNGDMDAREALDRLLADSGLVVRELPNGGLTVVAAAPQAPQSETNTFRRTARAETSARVAQPVEAVEEEDEREEAEPQQDVITVTGTSIRGAYPNSIPLEVFTAEDIDAMGVVSIEDFLTRIPQNLNGRNSLAPRSTTTTGSSSAANLRGLGLGATLVLINGSRPAAAGGAGPNLSLIPLAAVERVEILSDGASAVYGSDAIGGVINIILRSSFDGIQSSLAYGTVTEGIHNQFDFDQSIGGAWDGGSVLLGLSHTEVTGLDTNDRDFSRATSPYALVPDQVQQSLLFSANQEFGERLRVNLDALYSTRELDFTITRQLFGGQVSRSISDTNSLFASINFEYKIDDDIFLELSASQGEESSEGESIVDGEFRCCSLTESSYTDFVAKIDATLFTLPAGNVKAALGVGHSIEDYFRETRTGVTDDIDRTNTSTFAEFLIPIFSESNAIAGFQQLELNAALRHTEYSDFGSEVTPRLGVFWEPTDGLGFRATYSEGFRAPPLAIGPSDAGGGTYFLFLPSQFGRPDDFSDNDSSVYLLAQGSVLPSIGPERSESITIGLDYSPAFIDGLQVSTTYYQIEYVDRIGVPDTTGGFGIAFNPLDYLSAVTENPSADFLAEIIAGNTGFSNLSTPVDLEDPNALAGVVTVVLDNRLQNIAEFVTEGFDFSVSYSRDTRFGELALGAAVTHVLESESRLRAEAPAVIELNTVGRQIDLRGRFFASLTRNRTSGQININYKDDYTNTFVTPEVPIDSSVIVDLTGRHQFRSQRNPFLDGWAVNWSVQNVFDEAPPFVGVADNIQVALDENIGFDPANGSPVGRYIQVGISKRF